MELYEEDELNIYAFANDLKKPEDILFIKKMKERSQKIEKEFRENPSVLGTWKIREILPNISFDPTKQKSDLNTYYPVLSFYEGGKTNYENIKYNKDYLIITYGNRKTDNFITTFEINGKKYLEIRMSDLSMIYENARPISYIYEKIEEEV